MSRFSNFSKRRVASAGLTLALAVTGIAVLDGSHETPAGARSASAQTSVHSGSQSARAADRRAALRRHNPNGTGFVQRHGKHVRFHGRAVDPDHRGRTLEIALWHNDHRVALVRTSSKSHHYVIKTHLWYGKNRLRVLAKNIGKGTHHTRLHSAHMRLKGAWVKHFHGHKRTAAKMFKHHGWGRPQMQALVNLWNRESGWSTTAANSSGAYGIPQALPGSKMSSAGPNWQGNARTQMRWGLGYIEQRYGDPQGAWAHSQATGWY